jgi:hypothetical protein
MNNAISSALSLAPLVLAQSPAIGATELGQWLLAGAAVAVIANQGMAFFKNIMGGFAKKQTPHDERMPTIAECIKYHTEEAQKIVLLREEWEKQRTALHGRINAIAENVAFIRGKFEGK